MMNITLDKIINKVDAKAVIGWVLSSLKSLDGIDSITIETSEKSDYFIVTCNLPKYNCSKYLISTGGTIFKLYFGGYSTSNEWHTINEWIELVATMQNWDRKAVYKQYLDDVYMTLAPYDISGMDKFLRASWSLDIRREEVEILKIAEELI